MKRTRDGPSTISDFKELIQRNGKHVIQKEKSNIPDRSIDEAAFTKYIEDQSKLNTHNAKVLRMLKGAVTHISSDALFRDIEKISVSIWEKLKTFRDRRFYIVLSGKTGNSSNDMGDSCFYKSSMFVSTMILSFHPELAGNLVDFICDTKPMYTRMDKTVPHYFYIDDASFSGTQVIENMEELGEYLEEKEEEEGDSDDSDRTESDTNTHRKLESNHVHLVLLYVSPSTLQRISESISLGMDKVHWYTSSTHQKPVIDYVHEFIVNHPGYVLNSVLHTASMFLRGLGGSKLEKPLFYTDIKIADEVSTYPLFLMNPILIDGASTKDYTSALVTGCDAALTDDDKYKVKDGNFCPKPVYKGIEWTDFIAKTPLKG